MTEKLKKIMEDETIGKREYNFQKEFEKNCPNLYKYIKMTDFPDDIDAAWLQLKLYPDYFRYKEKRIQAGNSYVSLTRYTNHYRKRERKWNIFVNRFKSILIVILLLIIVIFGCYKIWGHQNIPVDIPDNMVKMTVTLPTSEFPSARTMAAYILDTYPVTLEEYDVKTLTEEILYINGIKDEDYVKRENELLCPYLTYRDNTESTSKFHKVKRIV